MKYVLSYGRTYHNRPIISYVRNFHFEFMDWTDNGRFSNADHFNLVKAQYIKRIIKHTDLYIKPVNY